MEIFYNFELTVPLEIEETLSDRILLKGTFLKLSQPTANGREYLVEEGEQIASSLVNQPLYFGAETGTNKHLVDEQHKIGRVKEAIFDAGKKIIHGVVEVWNNSLFPDLIQKVKTGWGFSIRGKVKAFQPTGRLNSLGRAVMKVIGMEPTSISLLDPSVKRGQQEARVEGAVEETMSFDPCPWGICEVEINNIESPPRRIIRRRTLTIIEE